MECNTTKPSSNILDFVLKFARVCRLISVGVFSSDNPKGNNSVSFVAEDGSDSTEETELDGVKIYPRPSDTLIKSCQFDKTEILIKSGRVDGNEIQKIFDTVSSLKVVYVQLQDAHVPYDPDKIRAADDLVVDRLCVLCKIKRAYKEKRYKTVKFESERSEIVLAEIQTQEKLLEKHKAHVKSKDTDILCLRRELQVLNVKNEVLQEKHLKKVHHVRHHLSIHGVAKEVSKSIHEFAKPLIGLMKASRWDLNLAANAIEELIVYAHKSHKKYAFEAYIARRMFYGFTLQSYDVYGITTCDDPINALLDDPTSSFAKFCQEKYLLVIHPKMEESFFGNLDHRTLVSNGKHPRTLFYQAFVKMANWIWVLQGIAGSVEPKAEIFQVNRGTAFSRTCMESVTDEDKKEGLQVAFMVSPGLRFGETLVKPRVFVY